MTTVTMLDFRKNAEKIIRRAQKGQRMILSYRGKPVMRLEPIEQDSNVDENDPFYSMDRLAVPNGEKLSNAEMDKIIYEG